MNDIKYWNLKQILESNKYPFSKGQLRAFLLGRQENGLKDSVLKIGKCLYFRMDKFDEWIEAHSEEWL